MAEPAVEYTYRYLTASRLDSDASLARVRLATSGGQSANPILFCGHVLRPTLFADALLTIGAVARSRFHVPPAALEKILRLADPVATASDERLRFEAFSSCGSAYARLDLLPEFADSELLGAGTTNVDLGAGIRAALAGVTDTASMGLDVGLDEVAIDVDGARHVERRVALPRRWVRGFLEVQAVSASMVPRLEADGAAFRRFLRTVPRASKGAIHVRRAGADLVAGHRDTAGSVPVGDAGRLRVLDRLAPRVRRLRIFAAGDGSSAWCLDLDDARCTLALSVEAWRGFSGEGRALDSTAAPTEPRLLARVRAALAWWPTLSTAGLAAELGADPGAVGGALNSLAASGLVGFDVAEQAYFHRELPFVAADVERSQPRLDRARRIVAEDRVRFERVSPDGLAADTVAWVRGRTAEYRVRLGASGRACTCPWWGRHPGDRGLCAHILAAELARGSGAAGSRSSEPASDGSLVALPDDA